MRIAHTMIRVGNLEKSIDFYTRVFGMTVFRQKEYPQGKFTLVFLGYGDVTQDPAIELTHNWDTESYDLGNGFGHIAIEVDDVYAACEKIKALGGVVTREAGPMKNGTSVIAFVKDPDGYMIELLSAKNETA